MCFICHRLLIVPMAKTLSTTHKKFGIRVKELRKEKDISQEDLAFKIGVDRSYMGFVERGERNPTLSKIIKIAKTFKITLEELFKGI